MAIFWVLLYLAIGAGAGWLGMAFAGLDLTQTVGLGAGTGLLLGQIHLFASRRADTSEGMQAKLGDVEQASTEIGRQVKVLSARTDAVEATLKHELTERRDALVSEMKQLESLIDRLSRSFETQLQATDTQMMAPQEDEALRAVREALFDGRVDLYLQPVVSLPQRRVAFYEGFTRLRRPEGTLILPADFLEAARRADLLGVIDNMTLFRCVQIVRRLAERDRRIGVFCNIAAASLEDDAFFPHFLDFMSENRDLAGALIFEIRADRFETRSRKMRESMDKLIALGFRFSIDHAGDVGLDLPRLQDAGVRFVKLQGDTLIDNLRNPSGPRPICAVQRQLEGRDVAAVYARYGVTLIAEKLEDEASVVEILAYDVPYGQGHVFGAPRPIKSSLMDETAPPPDFVQRFGKFG